MFRLIFNLIFFTLITGDQKIPGNDISQVSGKTLLKKGPNGSKLYRIESPNSVYSQTDLPYLLDLSADTSYLQGYDAGYLFGKEAVENFNSLMASLLGDEWWEPLVSEAIGLFLDEQWNDYLSVAVPQSYKDELKGITDGAYAAHRIRDVGKINARGIVLANLPSTLENFKFILQDEHQNPNGNSIINSVNPMIIPLLSKLFKRWKGMGCSMFGGRNLNPYCLYI